MALILTLLASIILAAGTFLMYMLAQTSFQQTERSVDQVRAEEAAKAGVDFGVYQLWGTYLESKGGSPGNMGSFIQYVANLVPNSEDLNGNGQKDAGETDSNKNGEFDVSEPITLVESSSPRELEAGVFITGLTAVRSDDPTGTTITLRSTGSASGLEQSVEQTIRISGKLFKGFDYAVLANNINCILCHAEITSRDLDTNGNAQLYNTFDRVKAATLERLMIRPTEAISHVAGTLYTRGDVRNNTGGVMTPAQISSSTFKGYGFSNTNGKITQSPSTGAMSSTSLVNGTLDQNGLLNPYANLYQSYPTDLTAMTDGDLPSSFPAPIPDSDGDRVVDDAEFAAAAGVTDGRLSGGVVYGVPNGQTYAGTALPAASNAAQNALSSTGTYDGNVILTGTTANPIVINGDVNINGDVVVRGVVKGTGRLMARGNAYVVGDVTYADAPGTFGKASDGTENLLSLVSGGNVLMGDYLTVRGKNTTKMEPNKYPNSTYSIQVRTANKSASVTTTSPKKETLNYGYFDPGTTDPGQYSATMVNAAGQTVARQGQQTSFTTSELMLFNRAELQKAVADPEYIPRFYGLRESQPNNLYTYNSSDEHTVKYTESAVQSLATYMANQGIPSSILTKAAKLYMNPKGNWLSEDTLRQFWYADEMSRTARNSPFRFDGLIYSNNAIFAITRSYSRHGSYSEGRMDVRGAIVCPDLGVLVPGNGGTTDKGLTLQYDPRVKDFMRLEDTTQVIFARSVFRWLNS